MRLCFWVRIALGGFNATCTRALYSVLSQKLLQMEAREQGILHRIHSCIEQKKKKRKMSNWAEQQHWNTRLECLMVFHISSNCALTYSWGAECPPHSKPRQPPLRRLTWRIYTWTHFITVERPFPCHRPMLLELLKNWRRKNCKDAFRAEPSCDTSIYPFCSSPHYYILPHRWFVQQPLKPFDDFCSVRN